MTFQMVGYVAHSIRMVFSTLAAQGVKGPEDCPELTSEKANELQHYISRFSLDA